MSFTVSNSTDRTCTTCGRHYLEHGKHLECPADNPYIWKGNRWTDEEMKAMKKLMCESQRVYEDGRVNYRIDMGERPEPIDPEPPDPDGPLELDRCKQAMTEMFTEAQLQDIYVWLYNRGHRINR